MNPYFGQDGWGFLKVFFSRLGLLLTGQLDGGLCASDEVQLGVLSLIAFSCALVGSFLVLKKMTMLANSLSHTILPGLVIAYLVGFSLSNEQGVSLTSLSIQGLLLASLATALMATFSTQLFHRLFKLQEDASIGLVCTTMTALGVVLVTLFTRNMHLGVEAVMGNVDALHPHDMKLAAWVALGNGVVITLFFKELKLIAFDSGFAKTQGFSEGCWNSLLMLLTSMTVVGAFRAVGMLLVLSFLVGPVLIARLFTVRLKSLILSAIGVGVLVSFFSVVLSRHILSVYHIPLSTAGIVSTLIGLFYFFSLSIKLTLQKLERAGKLGPTTTQE